MKTFLSSIVLFYSVVCFAQMPQNLGIGFQGYARKADGSAISNQSIRVTFSIYDESETVAEAVFSEIHNVNTDAYGVFTAQVGSINTADFNALRFDYISYKLNVQVSVNSGNNVTISDKPFNVVPYARAAGNGVPAGTIVPFAGNPDKVPHGWAACDGALVSPSDKEYATLFQAIGYNWGRSGDAFKIPDLRGVFLRGHLGSNPAYASWSPGADDRISPFAGGATGNNVGSYEGHAFAEHNHSINDPGHNHADGIADQLLLINGVGTAIQVDNDPNRTQPNITTTGTIQTKETGITVNNSGENETRPINASVLYIIKL